MKNLRNLAKRIFVFSAVLLSLFVIPFNNSFADTFYKNTINVRINKDYDLVVAQRQDELLGEGVHEREGQLAVVVAPVDGLLRQVAQGVVHPPHVPLQPEAQPAVLGGGGHPRPGGGLLLVEI